LHGIVNGIDERIWNPAFDPYTAARYDAATFSEGKPRCKASLQQEFKLDIKPRAPLFGMVSRLALQKGLDLVEKVIPDFLVAGAQLVVLGDGDKVYRDMLIELQKDFPRRVGLCLEQNEAIAHRIEAGADIFLMPSRYEPCGLNQLYSLRYGTIPVVHTTGGLADTVVDATEENVEAGRATGFAFVPATPPAFTAALTRCLTMYREQPRDWRQLQRTGMLQDWSWHRSAIDYERLYRQVLQEM
jgi:starch synthase